MISKQVKAKSKVSKEEWRDFTKTVWAIANVSDKSHPAVFPEEIPRRLIKLFSFHGETVLDPFAGTGTTATVASALGRKSISVDQSKTYVAEIRRRLKSTKAVDAEVVCGDSRKLGFIEDNSVSLIVTSPPYWNKADYGSGKSNIGTTRQYLSFIASLREALAEMFRVLAPGRKCCIVTANVNQYTDEGLLTFPLAADIVVETRALGFVLVNEVIWSKDGTGGRWGSSGVQRPIFGSYPYPPNFLFKNVHEHIIIVAKPRKVVIKNKKALKYSDAMGERCGGSPK